MGSGIIERRRTVNRILAVERQLHRREQWKAAQLSTRLRQLESEQHDIIRALNEDDALQGLFMDAMARRLRSLADEATRTATEREAQQQRVAELAGRVAVAERLAEALDAEAAREQVKSELEAAIERCVEALPQASRKIERQ